MADPKAYSSPIYTVPDPTPTYLHPPTTLATSFSTPGLYNQQETTITVGVISSTVVSTPFATSSQYNPDNASFWSHWHSSQIAIVAMVIGAILAIVVFSMWFCCGCCGGRCCGRKKRPPPGQENRDVPLGVIPDPERRGRPDSRALHDDLPPPQYEETPPLQHQTIEGGITHVREEEEGIISDGKTPLSEIPFEDVVLDHHDSGGSGSGSPSSAREFASRHHGLGGDTSGHTNS